MLRKIIVPLDTSWLSESAALKAGALARATSASVSLVHVYGPPFPAMDGGRVIDADLLAADRQEHHRRVARVVDEIKERFGCVCGYRMLSGDPADAIINYAQNERADLIVLSTHGRTGMRRIWFGSVADTLARESTVPVLLVRGVHAGPGIDSNKTSPAFQRVIVALDGSASGERVLETVRQLRSSAADVELLLIQVVAPVPLPVVGYPDSVLLAGMVTDDKITASIAAKAREYLDGIALALRAEAKGPVECRVLVAPDAAGTIAAEAREFHADLVALTSHGRGASRLMFGSVADNILRGTDCSILLRLTKPANHAAADTESARTQPACAI